jgi:uncharacterized protein YqcC (DUF446 family)
MNNSDMPASPIDEPGIHYGLTKREHFAAMAIVPVEILKEALKEGCPEGFTVEQYIEAAVQYKKKEADLLLAALEES